MDRPIIQMLPDFFFIQRGYLNANHFVYRGKNPTLIDTGYISDFSDTQACLAKLGVDLKKIRMIISTHCHCDHIGANRILQNLSNCDIALHRIGKHFIETRDDWSTWWRYYNQEAEFFRPTVTLEDGDEIRIGAYGFRVFHTPGHSADGIVLYHPEEGILISSDSLWENDIAVMTLRVEGSAALFSHLNSLKKLESLEVTTVYPGHGSPFRNAGEAIRKARKRVESYFLENEKIGKDLLKKIFIYTLLMKRGVDEDLFFGNLMEAVWFRETVDLYYAGNYDRTYQRILGELMQRDLVRKQSNRLITMVLP